MHVYVCMHMQVRPNQQGRHKAPNMRAMHVGARACMCAYMCVCVCVCDVNTIMRVHTYIHTHIQKHIHKHIPT